MLLLTAFTVKLILVRRRAPLYDAVCARICQPTTSLNDLCQGYLQKTQA